MTYNQFWKSLFHLKIAEAEISIIFCDAENEQNLNSP
jgi:hypothetical protein